MPQEKKPKPPLVSGVYTITLGDRIYVGCSWDIYNRWANHLRDALSGKHSNAELRRAVVGKARLLRFAVVREMPYASPGELRRAESEHIAKLRSEGAILFNATPTGANLGAHLGVFARQS